MYFLCYLEKNRFIHAKWTVLEDIAAKMKDFSKAKSDYSRWNEKNWASQNVSDTQGEKSKDSHLRGMIYQSWRKRFTVPERDACLPPTRSSWPEDYGSPKNEIKSQKDMCLLVCLIQPCMHILKNSANWSADSVIERYVNCERNASDKHAFCSMPEECCKT